jgi:hypothetical protein
MVLGQEKEDALHLFITMHSLKILERTLVIIFYEINETQECMNYCLRTNFGIGSIACQEDCPENKFTDEKNRMIDCSVDEHFYKRPNRIMIMESERLIL